MKTEHDRSGLWRWRYLLFLVCAMAAMGAGTIAFAGLPPGAISPKSAGQQAQPPSKSLLSSGAHSSQGPRSSMISPLGPGDRIPPPVLHSKAGAPGVPNGVLYDQYNNPAFSTVSSQNFEPAYSQYDSQAADDFMVPSGQAWLVNEIDVAGAYAGRGQADSVNVFFYENTSTLPATPVYTATNIVPASGLDTGNFTIVLDQPPTLPEGTYWVSVQANEIINPNGQWFWRDRTIVSNNQAAWRNPGGGFSTPCTNTWGTRTFQCGLAFDDPDQVFRLVGIVPPSPTDTPTGTPPTATGTPTGTPPTATDSPTGTATSTGTGIPTPLATVPIPVSTIIATIARDTATPQPACGLYWRVVDSPNPGSQANALSDVAALSATDIWAVGTYRNVDDTDRNLTMHWDGSNWGVVPVPDSVSQGSLYGVAASGPNDVWAVGYTTPDGYDYRLLILHWNGSAWTNVSAAVMPQNSGLNDIALLAPNDAWAVGSYYDPNNGDSHTLTLRWNGSSWNVVSSPNESTSNWLYSVSGSEPNDVWAAGTYVVGSDQTLTMHWDGSSWSIVPSLSTGDDAQLYSVSVFAPNDVWAVGYFFYDLFDYSTLTLHWNGNSWSFVNSPQPDAESSFTSVSMVGPNDVWAAGYSYYYNGINYIEQAQSAHWDGSGWTQAIIPDPGDTSVLAGLGTLSPDDLWAVGSYYPNGTLVERYNDPCATPSPTVTGTPPTATATRTRIPSPTATSSSTPDATSTGTDIPTAINTSTSTPSSTGTPTYTPTDTPTVISTSTNTPTPTYSHTATDSPTATDTPTLTGTPTATACTLAFTDVPNGSTFYADIRCLACRGIINGYPDGRFKPNNNVTRGQLSKIVSNSAGFSQAQTVQIFEDVPAGSTFFQYIGRLASRGYSSGYGCGGLDEPCMPPANLPYFRPNSNATRGQISKIVSNAAGFIDTPNGQQFQDIAIGSTYYAFTSRLATRNIVQGYNCGGPGEPCAPPANLPYFRPSNDATRGQTSKIDVGAFFPDCQVPQGPR
jgi:hypothetical protein